MLVFLSARIHVVLVNISDVITVSTTAKIIVFLVVFSFMI